MSQFAKLLEDNAEKLVERWVKGPRAAALRERLPQLLRSLIATLRQGATAESDTPAIQFGFDVQGVVREYGALASLLLDAAEEAGTDISPADVRVFTRFTASAVAQAVAVHGALQAETLRATEHAAHAADARKDHEHHAELARESMEARRREERLRRLLEAAGAGGWEFDVVARTIDADPSLLELHNVTPSPAIDLDTMMATLHPDDRAPALAAINAALDPRGTRRYHLEYRVLGKGGFRWIEAIGRALFDNDDTPMRLIGTAIDITQRKEAELAREGLLEALQSHPLLSVTVLEGPQLIVKLVNERWDHAMKAVMETGEPFVARNLLIPIVLSEGMLEDRYFDFVVQPLRGSSGAVDSTLNLSLDVTTSVEARRSLEQFVGEEKERAELERQIIGVVSHDLGNPIAAIKLSVRQLLDSRRPLEPAAEKIVHSMEITLEGVMRLINDLLDFTQARQGSGLSIVRAPMNVHEVVRRSVDELRALFPHRELLLEQEGDGAGSWDRVRLTQTTVNLLTNALKHGTPNTPVRVSTHGFADHIEVRVSNHGEPIPAELLPRLFEPLTRGNALSPELGRSVGLGLFIVKHIVDALGGTITVTSTPETGTTFVASFPR